MLFLLITLIVGFIVSLLFTLAWGVKGVFAGSILFGLTTAFILSSLSGFGNPTGYTPKFDFISFCLLVLFNSFLSFLFFYGIYYFKSLATDSSPSQVLTLVWVSGCVLLLCFYVGQNMYRKANTKIFEVTFGYDEEFEIQREDVKIFFKKGSKKQKVSFNSGGGSKEKNSYGFNRMHRAFKNRTFFLPDRISLKVLNREEISLPLEREAKKIIFYVDKDLVLRFFVDSKLISTHELRGS